MSDFETRNPEDLVIETEEKRQKSSWLNETLTSLTKTQLRRFFKSEVQEESLAQIAKEEGVARESVRNSIANAESKLRKARKKT